MSFEEELRNRISNLPFGSNEKKLLKVVLGEMQRENVKTTRNDEAGNAVVKKMIAANQETLSHLDVDDPRRSSYEEEVAVLQSLLPPYWTAEEIRERLDADGVEVKAVDKEGVAIGKAMQHLKKIGAIVEGSTVKTVVVSMRQC